MYRISIATHFDAAHQLHGYQGACGKLHGHAWKVKVEVQTNHINDIGISLDFKELKTITDTIIERFDHRHLNQVSPFDIKNPTAENLSRYIYEEIKKQLPSHVTISRVTVWESEKYAISYSEA